LFEDITLLLDWQQNNNTRIFGTTFPGFSVATICAFQNFNNTEKMFIQSFSSTRPIWVEGVERGRDAITYLRAVHNLPATLPLRIEYNGRALADLDSRYVSTGNVWVPGLWIRIHKVTESGSRGKKVKKFH
jgi:hypothetical protein